ncbi:MAG: hypothetical protein K2W85_09895 [Phycisphaerales bacterium]|nr:hypothetical protein [Phycisphaerales bacterium]
MRPTRVTLCTAAVGCGHTMAAKAVWLGLSALDSTLEINLIEALDLAPRWFTMAYRDGYLRAIAHAPALAGRLYDATDEYVTRRGLGHAVENAAMRGLVRHPMIQSADVVVTTHFLCARVLSWARAEGRLRAPLVVCVTDQHPHGVWLVPHADLTLVASETARQAAIDAGMAAERVRVTGIPINPRFSVAGDRAGILREHGLPSDRPIVLLSGGGLGLGGMEDALRAILESATRVHAVVICGKNEALRRGLSALVRERSSDGPSCDVLGYTTQMPELMAVADVMIGKPGGLTTSEASARGLPMVLLKPIPGQEERNAQRLVEVGAAVLEPDPRRAGALACEIIRDRPRLDAMRIAAQAAGAPAAAEVVARQVLAMAGARAGEAACEDAGGQVASMNVAAGLSGLKEGPCPAC